MAVAYYNGTSCLINVLLGEAERRSSRRGGAGVLRRTERERQRDRDRERERN